MRSFRNGRNISHKLKQNSHTIEPKSTEILSCYDTFITNEPYQLSKYADKSSKRSNQTGALSSLISLPFNDETIFLDQCSPNKCQSIKHFLKETNKEHINSFLLPMIKTHKGEILSNLLLMKPQKQYALHYLAKDVINRAFLSPNIHQLRSTYMIDKVMRNNKQNLEKVKISVKDNRLPEEIEESYDSVVFEDLRVIQLKKVIKEFLCAKDNKLNQIVFNKAELFKTYPDLVNYYCDIYLVPHFRNKLGNFENKFRCIDQFKNIIDSGICRYLNSLKIKIQREKDEKANKKNQVIEEPVIQQEKPKLNYLLTHFKDKKEQEVTYEYELFFGKISRYSQTGITTSKSKDIVLNKYQSSYEESSR